MTPQPAAPREPASAYHEQPPADAPEGGTVDLERRRDQLTARVAELQWDLGGLVYEMAIRDRIRVDVLVKRAAMLQDADAELGEVERILKMEETRDSRHLLSMWRSALERRGLLLAVRHSLLPQVSGDSIVAPSRSPRG